MAPLHPCPPVYQSFALLQPTRQSADRKLTQATLRLAHMCRCARRTDKSVAACVSAVASRTRIDLGTKRASPQSDEPPESALSASPNTAVRDIHAATCGSKEVVCLPGRLHHHPMWIWRMSLHSSGSRGRIGSLRFPACSSGDTAPTSKLVTEVGQRYGSRRDSQPDRDRHLGDVPRDGGVLEPQTPSLERLFISSVGHPPTS